MGNTNHQTIVALTSKIRVAKYPTEIAPSITSILRNWSNFRKLFFCFAITNIIMLFVKIKKPPAIT